MSFLKIVIEDPENTGQIEAGIAVLQSLLSGEASAPPTKKSGGKTVRGKRATGKKTKVEYDIDEVRTLTSSKANAKSKAKIIKKLKELGTKSVTDLDEDKYGEFVEFLNTLPDAK